MDADLYFDEVAHNWEEEGLFARDINGQLIRMVAATEAEYRRMVELTIDGEKVSVPVAVPSTDEQGNVIVDDAGRTVPRKTTIYDAAVKLFKGDNPRGDVPIPTVCHLEHLPPVGVCRLCSVDVGRMEPDPADPTKQRYRPGEKLVPACLQPVAKGMIVHTLASPDERSGSRVRNSVQVLLELLAADHLTPRQDAPASGQRSELKQLIDHLKRRYGVVLSPQRVKPKRPLAYPADESSPLLRVDHNACILCDRCVRACTDIKHNFVIGRTGKGYSTRIGFDLNDPMGSSSCVECGECMLSCPTTALTFRSPVESQWWRDSVARPGTIAIQPEELDSHRLLGKLPFRFRQWNQAALVRRRVRSGEILCREGEYGSTAFIIESGVYEIWKTIRAPAPSTTGRMSWLQGWFSAEAAVKTHQQKQVDTATADDLILGEMTCLSHYPRTATIRARTDGEVIEVRRNVLYALQRNHEVRALLDRVYRTRALGDHLEKVAFFDPLDAQERRACKEFLASRVQLVWVNPGQTIFRQNESADRFHMIRVGYVRISQTYGGAEHTLNYLGPNNSFGEIALVADWELVRDELPAALDDRRTASCTALDDVELVSLSKEHFRELLVRFPKLRKNVVEQARSRYPNGMVAKVPPPAHPMLPAFLDQGLFNGQRLLVLDLEACTRCDECTKACADTHGGVTRLVRDGLRFDKWLVASACRSCTDPYCLVGCPVDAIHREGGRFEIRIEDHCIGCGLCANNCPYGNINMSASSTVEKGREVVRNRATTCDLCRDVAGPDGAVSCVFACPHNAAFRMSGRELFTQLDTLSPG